MAKEIKWTAEAEVSFEKVVSYLKENWSEKEVSNFISITNKILSLISETPKMFRQSKQKDVHEAVITKHNLLLYRIKTNHIELITFWDTRQNPKRKYIRKK